MRIWCIKIGIVLVLHLYPHEQFFSYLSVELFCDIIQYEVHRSTLRTKYTEVHYVHLCDYWREALSQPHRDYGIDLCSLPLSVLVLFLKFITSVILQIKCVVKNILLACTSTENLFSLFEDFRIQISYVHILSCEI
jgi:hypothetical protein